MRPAYTRVEGVLPSAGGGWGHRGRTQCAPTCSLRVIDNRPYDHTPLAQDNMRDVEDAVPYIL